VGKFIVLISTRQSNKATLLKIIDPQENQQIQT